MAIQEGARTVLIKFSQNGLYNFPKHINIYLLFGRLNLGSFEAMENGKYEKLKEGFCKVINFIS